MLILLLLAQVVTSAQPDGVFATNIPPVPGTGAVPQKTVKNTFDDIIRHYCTIYGIDPELVRLVIEKESRFNHRAVSRSGAMGLMQLMPETAKMLGVKNPYNPRDNIMGGVKFLRKLFDMFNNDLELVLAAYHAGPGLVKRLGRVPAIPETIEYVDYIMSRYGSTRDATMHFSFTDEGTPFFTNRPKQTIQSRQ